MKSLKENRKGITLVSLVITIVVLLILVSIATYSGIEVIKSSRLTTFTTEMKIMQTQVNELYQRYKNGDNTVLDIGSVLQQANKAFNASGITEQSEYRYFDQNTIKDVLKIEGVEGEFFVNIKKRSVVSYEGVKYEGNTYYTLDQLPNGLYNVEYNDKNIKMNKPIFDTSVEKVSEGKWRVTVSNIQYEGYIDKWDVNYQLEGQNYKSEDLSFIVTQPGEYTISISNGNVKSNLKTVDVLITVEMAKKMNKVFDDNIELIDTYQNQLTIPKGFKIAEDSANDVTGGVVIEDATYDGTIGSQFVWIPVSDTIEGESYLITKPDKTTVEIKLGRYVFDSSGNIDTTLSKTNPSDQLKIFLNQSYYYTEGLKNSTTSNTHAKDIETFINSAKTNHGYYIGRYEARKSSAGNLTEVGTDSVYNGIIQPDAATASRNMYNELLPFTSDLMNSYAWDTAIVFEQTFDNRTTDKTKPYSIQNSLNTSLATTGTNNLTDTTKQDKICNIWDMASNYCEWTTETYSEDNFTYAVYRGGYYGSSGNFTSNRNGYDTSDAVSNGSFRPLLYL